MGTLIRINGMALIVCLVISVSGFAFNKDTLRKDGVGNHAGNVQYEKLQNALQHLYEIQNQGGWKKIVATQKFYLKGQNTLAIKQIKERLRITGEFDSKDTSAIFTEELVSAVQKAQKRFGYKQNGVVDALLIKQLNVPVEERIQQVLLNMQRFKNNPTASNGTVLIVNIPEYKLHVYEGREHVFDMDIVVGSEKTRRLRLMMK